MNRRDFIKKGLLAAGAASLVPLEGLAAFTPETAPEGAFHPAKGPTNAPQDGRISPPEAETTVPAETSPAGEKATPGSAGRRFLKSMMWGMIGMRGSSVLEKCEALKAAGFTGVEPYSHQDRQEMLEAMRQTGLKASSVCNAKHWSYPLSSPDSGIRRQGIDALHTAIEDARFYGTDAVLLVPGIVNGEVSYDQCWTRTTECLKEALPAAEHAGVRIGIENVWNNFLLSPLETARYIDQFDSPAIGAYFDVGNVMAWGWPEQWTDILAGRIVRIHLKDFSRKLADEKGRGRGFDVPLGEGEVDWPRVMASLLRNYDGNWLTIEHQGGDTGIFDFIAALPAQIFASTNFEFLTPKEAAAKHQPVAPLHVPYPISWADEERDVTAWLGNELQNEAFEELYKMKNKVNALKDPALTHDFDCLQASDHFYYMCTKLFSDGAIHQYFTPYDTPYEAFINYMNVLSDFIRRVEEETDRKKTRHPKEEKEPKETRKVIEAPETSKEETPKTGSEKKKARTTTKKK